jgi:3-isopropylmalate/(R)-2-methylmalate dehydratase large subunit
MHANKVWESYQMAKNIIEKIWDAHVVLQKEGHPAILAVDFMLIHEVTSAQAFTMLEEKGLQVFDTSRVLATLDHSIPTRKNRLEIYDPQARAQVATLRENCRKHKVPILDFDSGGQGIVHVIGPEQGLTQPGMTIVCGDSHTATHGAFGALAFGIGTSEVGHVLASGCLLQMKPPSIEVVFEGGLPAHCSPKDIILKLISQIGVNGGTGAVMEYRGKAISEMSMEGRMTICNMSIECGARAGLVSPDATTISFLEERLRNRPGFRWNEACEWWNSFASDEGAAYDRSIQVDLSSLEPMVTWGTNPAQAVSVTSKIPRLQDLLEEERRLAEASLEYQGLEDGMCMQDIPVQWAFLGSCTNGRIGDLRSAARILEGQTIHSGVRMLIVPGSEEVARRAREEGLVDIFEKAGAEFRMPGCSMCLGMNDDKVPPGERCISSSNRNFIGRQGPQSRTHLASPETVAASAIKGKITSAVEFLK